MLPKALLVITVLEKQYYPLKLSGKCFEKTTCDQLTLIRKNCFTITFLGNFFRSLSSSQKRGRNTKSLSSLCYTPILFGSQKRKNIADKS